MSDPILFFKILVYMCPVILMTLMFGNAIMSGTPIVFLLYLGMLYLSSAMRFLIYYLGKISSKNDNTVSDCPAMEKYLYTPISDFQFKENLSTFLFAFTIFYVFFPSGSFYLNTQSQLSLFIILIIYCVYDIIMRGVMRTFLPNCNTKWVVQSFKLLVEMVLGALLGFMSSTAIKYLGMGNYLYFSSNKNNPTKKVFRCGKISK